MERIDNVRISYPAPSKKKHKSQLKQQPSGYYPGFEDPFNPVRGEMAMWRAVITQALMDAASNSQKSEVQYHKREALAWLLGDSEDFITVCEYAGLDPCYVRRMAKAAILRGCQWRAPSSSRPAALPVTMLPPMEFKSFSPQLCTSPLQTSACA